jgi:hypothetical protein
MATLKKIKIHREEYERVFVGENSVKVIIFKVLYRM